MQINWNIMFMIFIHSFLHHSRSCQSLHRCIVLETLDKFIRGRFAHSAKEAAFIRRRLYTVYCTGTMASIFQKKMKQVILIFNKMGVTASKIMITELV